MTTAQKPMQVVPDGVRRMHEKWISVQEVAELLNVSKMTVYRVLDRDELEYVRVGRTLRISKSSLVRFLDQGGTEKDDDIAWREVRLA